MEPCGIIAMHMDTILYIDAKRDSSAESGKVPGMRRWCATRGWRVMVVYRDEAHPRRLRERLSTLLAEVRPAGCIVEASWSDGLLPARLFGAIPVVYVDYQGVTHIGRGVSTVSCDNEAAAKMAFRELSVGLPPSYAAVPGVHVAPWSSERIRVFRELCADEGKPCRVFPGHRGESRDERLARLCGWVKSLPANVAIFGANDLAACDVLRALAADGRAAPRNATVVGIDGRAFSQDPLEERVTTVRLDFERAGYLAAQALWENTSRSPRELKFGPSMLLRRKSTGGRGRHEQRVTEAVAMIRAEATKGLTARALAARFRGNRNHFEQRFREAVGHGILDEILHVRLEAVLAYLTQPETPISAIAAFCGFGSDIELRRLFRRRFNCSMRQWRKDHAR